MIRMQQQSRSVNEPRAWPGGKLLARPVGELLRVPLLFCLLLAHSMAPKIAAGQGDSAGEYELKAAMLYNLTRFVEWPPSAYPDPQAPILLCILGRDPFGSSLTSIVSRQTVNGRPVLLRHPQNDKDVRGCHVLYISSSERKTTAQILSTLKGSGVLTVGEMTQFAARGGMIQFSLQDQQVRFDINLDAASRAGLKISSRLLLLARIVKDHSSDSGMGGSLIWPHAFEIANSRPATGSIELERNSIELAVSNNASDKRRGSG